jgi:hypothetical protein
MKNTANLRNIDLGSLNNRPEGLRLNYQLKYTNAISQKSKNLLPAGCAENGTATPDQDQTHWSRFQYHR